MKLLFRIIGMLILLALFVSVYTVAMNWSKSRSTQDEFTSDPQTVGSLGGFHLLDDIKIEASPNTDFTRIMILTHLNRGTTLEGLDTPQAQVTLDENLLKLKLSDTAFSSDSQNEYLIQHHSIPVNYPSHAQQVTLTQPNNQDVQRVEIRLDQTARYRLQANPDDPGVIWVDILK